MWLNPASLNEQSELTSTSPPKTGVLWASAGPSAMPMLDYDVESLGAKDVDVKVKTIKTRDTEARPQKKIQNATLLGGIVDLGKPVRQGK